MADLIDAAREAVDDAYVPYSGYPVGAAIRAADGTVYAASNVENANLTNTMHAEAVALAAAVADGRREFDRVAVSSGPRDGAAGRAARRSRCSAARTWSSSATRATAFRRTRSATSSRRRSVRNGCDREGSCLYWTTEVTGCRYRPPTTGASPGGRGRQR